MRTENQNLGFASNVQEYFMQKTGRCLVLSSRDTELLFAWEATGSSVATICHGIDAALNHARRPPRDLFACKKFVEERIRSAVGEVRVKPSVQTEAARQTAVAEQPQQTAVAEQAQQTAVAEQPQQSAVAEQAQQSAVAEQAQQTEIQRAIHTLERAFERADMDVIKEAYQHALAHCRSLDDPALLDDVDQTLIADVVASLPPSEVESVNRKVQETYGAQLAKMSDDASRRTFLSKRNDLLRDLFGIVTVFE